MSEMILAVPAAACLHIPEGISPATPEVLGPLLDPATWVVLRRADAEDDETHRQLIPYVVLRHGRRLFCYRRGNKGERRLSGLLSVGLGGHVRPGDGGATLEPAAYRNGLWRELDEEVVIGGSWSESVVAVIRQEDTPVGRVHLGVVHVLDVERPDVKVRETKSITEPAFAPLWWLTAQHDRLEGWSKLFVGAWASGSFDNQP